MTKMRFRASCQEFNFLPKCAFSHETIRLHQFTPTMKCKALDCANFFFFLSVTTVNIASQSSRRLAWRRRNLFAKGIFKLSRRQCSKRRLL